MTPVDYLPEHYEEMCGWYEARRLPAPPTSSLPRIGKIVPGVAALFLYQTDSDVCLLENAITNIKADKGVRHEAIGVLVEACLAEARELGFHFALSASDVPKIVKQVTENHKFNAVAEPHTVLWRDLWAD